LTVPIAAFVSDNLPVTVAVLVIGLVVIVAAVINVRRK
jgi:hypothetical protein